MQFTWEKERIRYQLLIPSETDPWLQEKSDSGHFLFFFLNKPVWAGVLLGEENPHSHRCSRCYPVSRFYQFVVITSNSYYPSSDSRAHNSAVWCARLHSSRSRALFPLPWVWHYHLIFSIRRSRSDITHFLSLDLQLPRGFHSTLRNTRPWSPRAIISARRAVLKRFLSSFRDFFWSCPAPTSQPWKLVGYMKKIGEIKRKQIYCQ